MEKDPRVISIIPKPVKCELTSEDFFINKETKIIFNPKFQPVAEYLQAILSNPTGFTLSLEKTEDDSLSKNAIHLLLVDDTEKFRNESYSLVVNSDGIILHASHSNGIFYAIQTLRQLLPIEIESKMVEKVSWIIPGINIFDSPRFKWRGFMLDEGRHFHGINVVKRILDVMALHKLNVFHWHLTEDQGWRIDVKKYPKLAKVGAWRKASQIGGYKSFIRKKRSNIPHGGYYTHEDLREIVEYAQNLHIMVVPEIDLPGHSRALLAAYPEYSCTGGPFEVATDWGIFKDVLCPGKEQVFTFLEEILKEIVPIFPSPYFHIGGDEAPKDRWKTCSDCQKRIVDNNLSNENDLQQYFTTRLVKLLKNFNKIPIGWNEILPVQYDELDQDVIGQHWLHGDEIVVDHLRQGRKCIISRFFYTYLDYPYTMTPLRKSYMFDPIPEELEQIHRRNILGLEAPLWTEWIPTVSRIDWQTFPRLTALAEVAWSQQEKNYANFRKRLPRFLLRLDKLGIKYAKETVVDPSKIKRLFKFLVMVLQDPQNNVS